MGLTFSPDSPVDTTSTGPGLARTDSNCARLTAMGYLALSGAPTGGIRPGFPTELLKMLSANMC